MSTVTLEAIFGSLVNQLPEQEEAPFILNPAILPQPPDVITTDQLVIRIGRHGYHSYAYTCVDTLHFQADKRTYRLLGLCLLAKVFHVEPQSIQIILTNTRSNIRTILLDYNQLRGWNLISQYDKRPYQFTYVAQSVAEARRVLDGRDLPSSLLPLFTLTDGADLAGPCDTGTTRDVVRCVGSDYGSVLIADILLNLGRSSETLTEVVLESEYGFGGVGRGSAEVTFWLPGGIGYIDSD